MPGHAARGGRRASCSTRRGEELERAATREVPGYERWNLILVLLVTQVVQVLLLALAVFGSSWCSARS